MILSTLYDAAVLIIIIITRNFLRAKYCVHIEIICRDKSKARKKVQGYAKVKKCVLREDLNESIEDDSLTDSGREFQTFGAE